MEIAIALTAAVHLINNAFKVIVYYRSVNLSILLKFGIPAFLAAFPGALLLTTVSQLPPLITFEFFSIPIQIYLFNLFIALLLIISAHIEWHMAKKKERSLSNRSLYFGGIISGFFGGLSGLQGAFRSLFLIHVSDAPKQYIATNAAIGSVVDISRLIIYGAFIPLLFQTSIQGLSLIISSLFGLALGMISLKYMRFKTLRVLVFLFIHVVALWLIFGSSQ